MAAPALVLTLAVERGSRKGEIRQCLPQVVGRVSKGNDPRRLAIEFLPPPAARWVVSDLGACNGTFLNGAPLVPS